MVSSKLCPVSICNNGMGTFAGKKAFLALSKTSRCCPFRPKKVKQDFEIEQLLHGI